MKKLLTLCLLLIFTVSVKAQQCPASIEDLKGFIGYNTKEINKEMKKKGFPHYFKDDDGDWGPFTTKYFDGEEWGEIKLFFNNDKVIGVQFYFTPSQYMNMFDYFKVFDWNNIYDGTKLPKIGITRQDIWVSEDKKWKVSIDYGDAYSENKNVI